jgi:hypothetical protein
MLFLEQSTIIRVTRHRSELIGSSSPDSFTKGLALQKAGPAAAACRRALAPVEPHNATILSQTCCGCHRRFRMGGEMPDDVVLENWRLERVAIEQEMKQLLLAGPQATLADRRVRQIQFAALIERRNAAMRHLLQTTSPDQRC